MFVLLRSWLSGTEIIKKLKRAAEAIKGEEITIPLLLINGEIDYDTDCFILSVMWASFLWARKPRGTESQQTFSLGFGSSFFLPFFLWARR